MSFFKGVSRNLKDAITLGPTFPLRHVSGMLGRKYHTSAIKGAGDICFRPRSSDAQIITDIFVAKSYDLSGWRQFNQVMARYQAILAAGQIPVIIDAGANIGIASIWFSKRFPAARLIAVEPDAGNAELCRLNTRGLPNVTVVEAAIGSENGRASLSSPDGEAWSFQTRRNDSGSVSIFAVEDLMRDVSNNARLFIAKIDIEGFEDDLFSDNTRWVDDVEVIIIEPHDWLFPGTGTSRNFQRAISKRPFEVVISGENLVYIRIPDQTAGPSSP